MHVYLIDLVSTMKPIWNYVLTNMLALFFIVTCPCLIRQIIGIKEWSKDV